MPEDTPLMNQGDNQPDASVEIMLNVPEGTINGRDAVHSWHEFKWKWPVPAVGSHVNFGGLRFKVVDHEWFYDHLKSGISVARCEVTLEAAQPRDELV